MSDDPLDRALAAYGEVRRSARPAAPDSAATRARLLRSVAAAERRRSLGRWGTLAVLFLASNATTWAWTSGRVERAVDAWTAPVEVGAPASAATVPVIEPAVVVPVVDEPAAVEPVVTGAAVGPRVTRSRPVEPAAPDTRSGGAGEDGIADGPADAEAAVIDIADRLAFEGAHHAHFRGGDDDAALRAWEDYLARFPSGRFVPEAMFNRAICLVRLGRDEEARTVLERIATGAYGATRRDDARTLLERLRADE